MLLSGVKYPTGLSDEMISKNWGKISKNVLLLLFTIIFFFEFYHGSSKKEAYDIMRDITLQCNCYYDRKGISVEDFT